MANQNILYLRPLSAVELIDKLVAVITEDFRSDPVHFAVSANVPKCSWSINGTGGQVADHADLTKVRQFFVDRPYAEVVSASIQISQGQNPSFVYELSDTPGVAVFDLSNVKDREIALRASDSLHKHFALTTGPTIAYDSVPAPIRDSLKLQEQALQSFSVEIAKLGEFATQQMRRNEEHIAGLTRKLQEQFQTKETALEAEYQTKSKALTEREEKLKAHEQEFDLRANTVVRRDLLKQMRSLLEKQEELKLSEATSRKRWPIHTICVLTMLVGLTVFGVTYWNNVMTAPTIEWQILGPLSFGGLLFASTLIYYIRWSDHWFRSHADSELANRKLMSDFLRASWLAELVIESEGDTRLPESLLAAFSQELFRSSVSPAARHPMDQVEDLFRRLTRVKIGPDQIEVEKTADKK